MRRNLAALVLDLSEVESMGGSSARLLNRFARTRLQRGLGMAFVVTSPTVRGFLKLEPGDPGAPLFADLEQAVRSAKESSTVTGNDPIRALFADMVADKAAASVDPGDDGEPAAVTAAPTDSGHAPPAGNAVAEPEARSDPAAVDDPEPEPSRPILLAPEDDTALPAGAAMQQRIVEALCGPGLASRVHVFEMDEQGDYYLVTRQGADYERGLPGEGSLVREVHQRMGPCFLFDVCSEPLSTQEEEVLTEINCELVVPMEDALGRRFLVFMSKEQPGEEYADDELAQVQGALNVVAEAAATPGSRPDAPAAVEEPGAEVPGTATEVVAAGVPAATAAVRDAETAADGETAAQTAAETAVPATGAVDRDGSEGVAAPAGPVPRVAEDDPAPRAVPPRDGRVVNEAERPLLRRLAQMRDILHLNQDFDAAFGTSRVLEIFVLSLVSVARVDTVLFFTPHGSEFRLTHQRGMRTDDAKILRLHGDSSLVQAALVTDDIVRVQKSGAILEEEKIWARKLGVQLVVPFRFKDQVLGLVLLGNSTGPAEPDPEMLAHLLGQAALAFDRARLYETLQDHTLGVVRGLVSLIESRSGYDCGSTERVVRYTQVLARELQYPMHATRDLIYGAVLRDIGMLRLSEETLNSSRELSSEQWEAIRRHPIEGASVMRQMRFSDVAIDVVLHHHEAYNGEGYPMGLRGRAIPLGARIVAVAESFVKMIMDRPYRKALGRAEALESIAENWGLRYDPLIVDALVRVVNRELSLGLDGEGDFTRGLFGV